jgi:hypothetical protein
VAYTRPDKFNVAPYVLLRTFGPITVGSPLEFGVITLPVGTTELAIAWEGVGNPPDDPFTHPVDLQIPNDGPLSNPFFGDWIGGGGYRVPLASDPNVTYWASFLPGPGGLPQGSPPGRNLIQPYGLEYPTHVAVRLLTGGTVGTVTCTGGELFYADPFVSPPIDVEPTPCGDVPRVPYPYTATPASISLAQAAVRANTRRIMGMGRRLDAAISVEAVRALRRVDAD